jgi:hypothetical protein
MAERDDRIEALLTRLAEAVERTAQAAPSPSNVQVQEIEAETIRRLQLLFDQTREAYAHQEAINDRMDANGWQTVALVSAVGAILIPEYLKLSSQHVLWAALTLCIFAIGGLCIAVTLRTIGMRVVKLPALGDEGINGDRLIEEYLAQIKDSRVYADLLARAVKAYTGPIEGDARSPMEAARWSNVSRRQGFRDALVLLVLYLLVIAAGTVIVGLFLA